MGMFFQMALRDQAVQEQQMIPPEVLNISQDMLLGHEAE